ncbi:MAG: hypothetical protein JKX75_01950 [Gammaproteobacteria bacterium]|nr:hypothetical protein [Gammaproteobacteria bacterium]
MNNILAEKGIFSRKAVSKNAVPLTLVAATFLFSSNVFANRPAMEDHGSVNHNVVENISETRPTALPETSANTQPEVPSSVDLMMQNQARQTTTTTGDIVQLPAKEMQAGETVRIQLLDYPRRGMSMKKVQHEFGQPITVSDSVGKPPITHWTYNDRVVYFEYSTVLHVVAR